MPVDAGSISSSVRIRLSELNADIIACKTALDNLGTEFQANAEKYSTLAGKKYVNSLKTIATEMKNVEGAAKAGALSEQQAIQRLIDLRKTELQILQNKAVKEGTASSETVAAIRKTEAALTGLQEKQKLLEGGSGGGGFVGTFARIRDVMMGPIAAAKEFIAILHAVGAKLGEMEDEWAAASEASALLGNTLKTTGADAWTTKDHLEEMAGSLQAATKYGDETIESMQTVLLGFRNIQGVNFDKATEAVLDMATVMKMDLTAAAQAVGKALDNPALGLDSLSKQGFKFTKTEKDMMIAMQESGDIAGAQAIIMKELDKTYGGASRAAGELAVNLRTKLKNAMGDAKEAIGQVITEGLAPMRQRMIELVADWTEDWKALWGTRSVDQMQGVIKQWQSLGAEEKNTAEKIIPYHDALKGVIDYNEKLLATGKLTDEQRKQAFATNAIYYQQIDKIHKAYGAAQSAAEAVAAAEAKAAAKREADAAATALQLEINKARNDLEDEYNQRLAEINRMLKAGAIDEKAATEERQSALKSEVDGLTQLVEKYDLADDATFNLRAEKTKLYVAGIKGAEVAKIEAKASIDTAKNALDFQQKYAKAQAEASAATNRAIDDSTEAYRKQANAIVESGMTASEKADSQRAKALALADAYEAEGRSVTDLRNAINEYFDLVEQSDAKTKLDEDIQAWSDYSAQITSIISDLASAIGSMYENEIAQLDARYEHERELIENNGKSKEEAIQAEIDAAIAAGDAEAEAEARKKLELFKLDEKYEKDKAKLQYKADMAQWSAKGLTLAADTAVAIMKAWPNLLMVGLTTAAGVAQAIAWGAAKPQPPAMATGGIVLPQAGGVPTVQAENGYPELDLNGGPSGRAFMQAFAAEIASVVVSALQGQPGQQILVQLTLDGRVIAESTVRQINDGAVRLNR
jgi:hypothetical protein